MHTLCISHASRDDVLVRSLEDWLQRNGFTDFFADHSAIRGGDKWIVELRRATARCRVVLCVVTESWLESVNCFTEFLTAQLLGRRIIPLFRLERNDRPAPLEDRLRTVRSEDQGYDFTPAEIAPNGYHAARDRRAAAERTLAAARDRHARRPDAVSLLAVQAARARAEQAVLDERRDRRRAAVERRGPPVPTVDHRKLVAFSVLAAVSAAALLLHRWGLHR